MRAALMRWARPETFELAGAGIVLVLMVLATDFI